MLIRVFLIIFVPFVFGKKYVCYLNDTINVKLNEIIFFESSDYPSYNRYHCLLNFSLIEPKETQKLLLAFEGAIRLPQHGDKIFNKKFMIFDKQISLRDILDPLYVSIGSSFQGFVTHEDIASGCPLEAISNPLIIHDETEIIHIRSTYFENEKRSRPCIWQFKTSQKYGFKVVIEAMNFSSSTQLTIENSTEAFLGNDIAKTYHPYYNRDNYIKIQLSLDPLNETFIPEIEFQAYISIVKKEYYKIDADCSVATDYVFQSTWTNNILNGYDNNAQCAINATILLNHGILVQVNKYFVEKGVDYVHYSVNGENDIIIESEETFFLQATKDQPYKYVNFQFISDGSVASVGFEIVLSEYECKCAETIIPCNSTAWNIMDTPTKIYCGNLICKFIFEPCDGSKIHVVVTSDERDTFLFSSNNETVLEINKYNHETQEFVVFLNHGSTNALEANTFYSPLMREFYIDFIPDAINEKIVLSNDLIFCVIDNSVHDIFEVTQNLPENNISFVLYTSIAESSAQIYNNKSLTINYSHKNCFAYPNPYKCVISYPSFVVSFRNFFEQASYAFLAIRLAKSSKGCIMKENIYVAQKTDESFSVVALSNFEGSCELKLLIPTDTYFYVTHLWTTSARENVKIYVGVDTSQLLFQFNSKSIKAFNHINLFSSIYSIVVPPNSTFFMVLKQQNSQTINVLQHPFRTIIATPNFNIFQSLKCCSFVGLSGSFLSFNIGNVLVKFTIVYRKIVGDFNIFHFAVNKEVLLIDGPGTFLTFKNQTIDLFYKVTESEDIGAREGVVLYVESIEN